MIDQCTVSKIDGQGNSHRCRREPSHSGEHRFSLTYCPATQGDCEQACVGSNCNRIEKPFSAEVADVLAEAAKAPCNHVSPTPGVLCTLHLAHEGMHANHDKLTSWPTEDQKHRWAEGAVFSPRGNGGTCTQSILCPLADGHEGVCQQAPGGYCADPIKPDYYHGTTVDDFIAEFNLGFRLGSVIKYIARHEHKAKIQDLKKAQWYLAREIEKLEGK